MIRVWGVAPAELCTAITANLRAEDFADLLRKGPAGFQSVSDK
jgi:hypothetical protein